MVATAEAPNFFYHQWDLTSKLAPVAVPLLGIIWWLIRRDHSPVKTASLQIKQAVTAVFIRTVVDEAKRLLAVLDDHLPEVLSQASVAQPTRSRFDHFCNSLRNISPEQLDRSKYKEIIVDSFAGIIGQTVSRLIDSAASSSKGVTDELLNPSGLRLQLEGAVHLKFAFVSRVGAAAIGLHRRYTRLHNFAIIALTVATVALFVLWIPTFSQTKWAWNMSIACLIALVIAVPAGLIAIVMSHFAQQSLERTAEKYKDEAGLDGEFAAWKSEQAA